MSYTIQLKCGNCNHEWERTVESGMLVVQKLFGAFKGVRIGKESITGNLEGDIEQVKCSRCETTSKIKKIEKL